MNEPTYRVGDPAPPPLPRRTEAEVMARWQGDEPVVSILCATYQHVGFVEDALRGFLGQDTDFPFEILVRDDASTDGTADIVRDYAERYPNIIRAVLETENRWHEVTPGRILRPLARGRFVAFCEGDDYWIDPSFVQVAREQLEEHEAASGVVARTVVCHDGRVVGHERPDLRDWQWYLPLRALMHRQDLDIPRESNDMWIALAVQQAGELHHLDRYVVVYRKHGGGIWSGLDRVDTRVALVGNFISIAHHLAESGELELAAMYQRRAVAKVEWMLEAYGMTPPPPATGGLSRLRSALGASLERLGLRRP